MSLTVKALRAARSALEDDPDYRTLGSADATVCLKAGSKYYQITFHAFRVSEVRSIEAREARDVDFVISVPDWDTYLAERASGQGRTLLELDLSDPVVSGQTPRARIEFLRYHLSIQAFIDATARAAA